MSADEHRFMTEERVMIREVARAFTMDEVLPVANELDPASVAEQACRDGIFRDPFAGGIRR